jgi:hypothetical protein
MKPILKRTRMLKLELKTEKCATSEPSTRKPTKPAIDERRKQELIEDMTKKFGKVTVGVHGMELPQFSENGESKQYWKYLPHDAEPRFQSRLQLKQSQKYWAVNDKMLLADIQEEHGPQD